MLESILQEFEGEAKEALEKLEKKLRETFDFAYVEQALTKLVNELLAALVEMVLTKWLIERDILAQLKQVGGRLAMRFKEYREVALRLGNGETIKVQAPYFIKAKPKRGPKKRGPNGRGAYLGLDVLGFVGHGSPQFVSEVVKMALLCPSFEIAKEVLAGRGMVLDVKTLRRLCRQLGAIGLEFRGRISLSDTEPVGGYTLVIGIDGGRLRERRKKPGRKKKGQKRQGYHTNWREPKLFTLFLIDEAGHVVKEFTPLHDATMGNHQDLFALLERYLQALDLTQVQRLVFCGDGAPWIWSGVEALRTTLSLDRCPVYQVLDYTHAKQNLQEIIDLLPASANKGARLSKQWKEMLWQGDIQGLYQAICQRLKGKKKQQALKKWRTFFQANAHRMQYAQFKADHLPCGSGQVESAIRRVINLRLKAAGTFWTQEMAEFFLFLRSQLVSGRWQIFIRNVIRRKSQLLETAHVA